MVIVFRKYETCYSLKAKKLSILWTVLKAYGSSSALYRYPCDESSISMIAKDERNEHFSHTPEWIAA